MAKPIKMQFRLFVLLLIVSWTHILWSANSRESESHSYEADFACEGPTGLFSDGQTPSSAILKWVSFGDPQNSWNIELVREDDNFTGTPTHTNITTNPFTVTGLSSGVRYKFKVQAFCDFGDVWSTDIGYFTTDLTNPSPCAMDLAIPDNYPPGIEFPITISSAPGSSLGGDVILKEVRLIIEHDWERDLDIYLISPTLVEVRLAYRNGGANIFGGFGNLNDPSCANYTSFSSANPNDSCHVFSSIGQSGLSTFVGSFFPLEPLSNFNDFSNPVGDWTIRIVDDRINNKGQLEFAELVFESFNCTAPGTISATTIADTSITLNWQSDNSCLGAIVEYGPVGFTPGSGTTAGTNGTVILASCPPYQLTGLSAATEYDIYVRTLCANGNYSQNSCPLNIFTNCNSSAATLTENFDALPTCTATCGTACPINSIWTNASDDSFDWTVYTGATPTANTGPQQDVSNSGNYIYLETSNTPCWNGNEAILISQCIEVSSSGAGCDMSFYYHMFGGGINSLDLQISTDGALTWQSLRFLSGNQGNIWKRAYIDLSAYDGEIVQFRFVGKGGSSNMGNIALDEIQFFGSTSLGVPSNTFYQDNDGDGFGNAAQSILICADTAPAGYVSNADDCDDNNTNVNPDAQEIYCNKIDENCNGMADDALLPSPAISNDSICPNDFASLSISSAPFGTFNWYDAPVGGNLLATGNSYNTPALIQTDTFYVEDSSILAPGLRITEIEFANPNRIEIQSIGIGGDYTGWKIVFGDDNLNINTVNPIRWALNVMNPNEIAVRSNTDLGGNLGWFPFFGGWAMIIDDNDVVVDALFWKWSAAEIANFNTTIDGVNYTIADLPWSGKGVVAGFGLTIQMTGTEENNVHTDYLSRPSTVGNPNLNFDLSYICKSERVPVIVEINPIELSSQIIPNLCNKNYAADIDLTATGGFGSLTYSWSNGTTTQNQNAIQAGLYQVTVSDSRSCSADIANISVSEPQHEFKAFISNSTDISCFGFQDGSVTAVAFDGTAPYLFEWSNGKIESNNLDTNIINNLIAGSYAVTITDANNCVDSVISRTLTEPDALDLSIQKQDVSCFDFNDGSISATASGGVGNYTYNWSNSKTTANIDSLSIGYYTLELKDANACTYLSDSIEIIQPQAISLIVDSVQNVDCKGFADGAIATTVSGGTSPYTYDWTNNNQNTDDIQNLSGGIYTLEITDAHNCQFTSDPISIQEAAENISIQYTTQVPEICLLDPKGSIQLNVTGGQGNYSFLWNDNATTKDRTELSDGTYEVLVTDELGCQVLKSDIILEIPNIPLEVNLTAQSVSVCQGDRNGAVLATVNNGTGPYQYNWNIGIEKDTNTTNYLIEHLSSGEFQLTVTDNNGCVAVSEMLPLAQPEFINPILSPTPVSCFGDSTGAIDVTMNASMPLSAYEFRWSNGSQEINLNNVPADYYELTITNPNTACSAKAGIEVIQPNSVLENVANINPVSCYGMADGSIALQPKGGTPNYSYTWNDGTHNNHLTQLSAGSYQVTIEDAAGCQLVNNINITSPDSINLLPVIRGTSCPNSEDGVFQLITSGGTLPYSYHWSNNENTSVADLQNLKAGTYQATVTDRNGCTSISPIVEIEAQNNPSFDIVMNAKSDPACYGDCSGKIAISVTPSTASYDFEWSHGATTKDIENLCPASYQLTVTDAFGCTKASENFEIIKGDPVPPLAIQDSSVHQATDCNGSVDGSISLDVLGGVGPYQFDWSDGMSTMDDFRNNLAADIYWLTITDAKGCAIEESFEVSCSTSTTATALGIETLKLYPNPTNAFVHLDLILFEPRNVSIEIYSLLGQQVIRLPEERLLAKNYEFDLTNFSSGLYFVRILLDQQYVQTRKLLLHRD